MTLSGIMKLALRQLDEAAEDISEYDELFRSYANMGYMIALRQFLRPRETVVLETDGAGEADIEGLAIMRVVEAKDARGNPVRFSLAPDGKRIHTDKAFSVIYLLCETEKEPMTQDAQEPKLPPYAHPALADYICYRHLSSGNLNKQSRAEFFKESFYRQMRALTQEGTGSVTRMKGLYDVT